MDNRKVVERFAEAIATRDLSVIGELMHPEIEVTYPQSGEVIRGRSTYLAMLESFPAGVPTPEMDEPSGERESVHVTATPPFGMPIVTVIGSGDTFVMEGATTYGDGSVWNVVMILKVRDGRVAKETSYFATPFDAPEWRRPYVEA